MKCERCVKGAEATYRVYSDAMEMQVCALCAAEAQRLGIAIELLQPDEVKSGGAKSDFSANERGTFTLVIPPAVVEFSWYLHDRIVGPWASDRTRDNL